jgi:hypothetical protein
LAKVQPRTTLLETIHWVDELSVKKEAGCEPEWEFGQHLIAGDTLYVPQLNFNIRHSYSELAGGAFLNERVRRYWIAFARQYDRFRLGEGAMPESRAAAEPQLDRGDLIFDRPFLLDIKEKQGKYPYLAIWVDNPEILMKK